MLFGASIFVTEYSISPDELAREMEQRGFESLWVPEHTHIPASRRTPYPAGGDLPKEYWHTYDPFLSLTTAAAATTRLRLATGICLLIERDPIVTAKEVATLDRLSNGRFIFGIGGGWNAEEMENHGTDFKKRWRILRERVLAMKEIWTQEKAEFHGEFVNFDPILSFPKPVQKPHPPIVMGGNGPTTIDRVVEYCDEWMPIAMRTSDLAERIETLKTQAAAAGRNPDAIPVTIFAAKPEREAIERLASVGISRVVFLLPPADREVVLPLLDRYAGLM
ncbi:MAG: LLM class F420-dependent oxidoreductase [Blastocatellia bacterium]